MKKLFCLIAVMVFFTFAFAFKPIATTLTIRVTDAVSGQNLTSFDVKIAENGSRAHAAANSVTLDAPYLPDPRYIDLPPYGTVTLIVTKQGYLPTILSDCIVYLNADRKLTVNLFPNDGSLEVGYVTLCESPSDEWVRSLLS